MSSAAEPVRRRAWLPLVVGGIAIAGGAMFLLHRARRRDGNPRAADDATIAPVDVEAELEILAALEAARVKDAALAYRVAEFLRLAVANDRDIVVRNKVGKVDGLLLNLAAAQGEKLQYEGIQIGLMRTLVPLLERAKLESDDRFTEHAGLTLQYDTALSQEMLILLESLDEGLPAEEEGEEAPRPTPVEFAADELRRDALQRVLDLGMCLYRNNSNPATTTANTTAASTSSATSSSPSAAASLERVEEGIYADESALKSGELMVLLAFAALMIMREGRDDLELVRAGVRCIKAITSQSTLSALERGQLPHRREQWTVEVVRAMRRFPDDVALQAAGIAFMREVDLPRPPFYETRVENALQYDMLPAVLDAMARFPTEWHVQEPAANYLAFVLVAVDEIQGQLAQLVHERCVPLLVAAIRNNPDASPLAHGSIISAIKNILRGEYTAQFEAAGLLPLLVKEVRANGEGAMGALDVLGFFLDDRDTLKRYDAVALFLNALPHANASCVNMAVTTLSMFGNDRWVQQEFLSHQGVNLVFEHVLLQPANGRAALQRSAARLIQHVFGDLEAEIDELLDIGDE